MKDFDLAKETFPLVKLKNELVVANFSSNHPFKFVDGSILPPCEDTITSATMMTEKVKVLKTITFREGSSVQFIDVRYKGNVDIDRRMKDWWMYLSSVASASKPVPHLMICPRLVLDGLGASHIAGLEGMWAPLRFVGTIMVDRVTKTVSDNQFYRTRIQ